MRASEGGDFLRRLSENSEYEEAKNEQAFVERRIVELEEKVKYARIIEEKGDQATVQLGTRVVIRNLNDKKSVPEEYVIVGSTEADPLAQKISNESPVGSALLEKKKGDIIRFGGQGVEYELVSE